MTSLTRNPRFNQARFVLCIDVGTTFTAASYCIVPTDKNIPKTFQEINKWPKQLFSNAKIPSTIYYDRKGEAQLLGAETEDMDSLYEAQDNKWGKAEWWKLHLRPDYLPLPRGFRTQPLPPNVTVDKAFQDIFTYVLKCVRLFVSKAIGDEFWGPLSSSMFVVLTTPNGWEGQQQNRMRNAAIKAGLVSITQKNRLRFVSEGEAAVHYCLEHVPVYSLKVGEVVLVCDAGGGTADIGIYKVIRLQPLFLEEILSPRCIVTGGVYVDSAARKLIQDRLQGSRWDSDEVISKVLRKFEQEGKRAFTGTEESIFLQISDSGESDKERGIVRGRFKLTREEMQFLFEPSIYKLTEGLGEVMMNCHTRKIDQAFIVGGFAESDYVYSKIVEFFKRHKIPAAKPDGSLSKAIAHGGLSWHFESSVQVRMTRLHYGAETDVLFDANDPEMTGRAKYKNARGEWRVRNAWKCIVAKNTRIRTEKEHREDFHRDVSDGDDLEVEMELYAYRLENPPMFYKDKDGNLVEGFVHLGTVKGDLAKCYEALIFRSAGVRGKKAFKSLEYEVGLVFGDTELAAKLHWKQNGTNVVSEAVISYDM